MNTEATRPEFMTPEDHDAFLTRAEAAEILRCRPQTLALWAHEGRGPRYFRPDGGRCLYRASDVNAWLARQAVTPGKPRLRAVQGERETTPAESPAAGPGAPT